MIGHDPMQPQLLECILNRELNNTLHIALALVAFSDRVTHVAGLHNAAHNIADGTAAYDMGLLFVGSDKVYGLIALELQLALFQALLPVIYRVVVARDSRVAGAVRSQQSSWP